MRVTRNRSSALLLISGVLLMVSGSCSAQYVLKSILCDDMESICESQELPYEKNDTVCGDKKEYLNPTRCNCGSLCIADQEEGEPCYTTSFLTFPQELCGPGLECISPNNDGSGAVCTRNPAKKCINETIQYDNEANQGTLGPGRYKPNCDEYGRYANVQCSPGSTCYCVNSAGERLFGEASITEKDTANCKCSAYWEEAGLLGLDRGMRCLPNGNFDPLQCIDDSCFCYNDTQNSVPYGPFPTSMIESIPCFDPKLHHRNYTNPCHVAQQEWDAQADSETVIVGEATRPICNHDGYYAAVQFRGAEAYCTDIHGNQIEDFVQPIYASSTMTCNCARRRFIMEETGYGASKPKCCSNGNYAPWQKRGLLAYCVDGNGNQVGSEVAATDLSALWCYTTVPCAQA